MARTHAEPLISRTTNRASTSCRKDSRLILSWMRTLLASVANSKRVMPETAKRESLCHRTPPAAAFAPHLLARRDCNSFGRFIGRLNMGYANDLTVGGKRSCCRLKAALENPCNQL